MRVRIILRDGYHDRFGTDHDCGEVWDAPDAIAAKLLRRGMALPVAEAEVETTAVEPRSNAARRTGKPRPRKRA